MVYNHIFRTYSLKIAKLTTCISTHLLFLLYRGLGGTSQSGYATIHGVVAEFLECVYGVYRRVGWDPRGPDRHCTGVDLCSGGRDVPLRGTSEHGAYIGLQFVSLRFWLKLVFSKG